MTRSHSGESAWGELGFLSTIAALVLVGVVAWSLGSEVQLGVDPSPLARLPEKIGPWRAVDIPLDPAVEEVLRADFNLQRVYAGPDREPIFVYIGYYGTRRGGRPEHTPRGCYTGAGWGIESTRTLAIGEDTGLRANEYVVERDGRRQLVLFWYRSHRRTGMLGGLDQNLDRLVGLLRSHRADGALVRVSAAVVGDDLVATRSQLVSFASRIDPILGEHWPIEAPCDPANPLASCTVRQDLAPMRHASEGAGALVVACWVAMGLSIAWIGFTYVGYPLAMTALARWSPRPVRRADIAPSLSVVIAVHNGEPSIRQKLESTIALEYDGEIEILVASDGSTDATNRIVEEFAPRGVRLVPLATRCGKEAAQAAAIAKARGDVLVFTDVTAELEPDALAAIVRPLADPSVGCVSSEDRVDSDGGEGAYVRFEMALRRLENEASSLVGLSGSFFAVRREFGSPWPADLASDFRSALEAARRGFRAVSEPNARARFKAMQDPAREWHRKVRTVRRGIAVLSAYRDLLHPRHGRVAFSLWGHKVARFTSPFALISLAVASTIAAVFDRSAAVLCALQVVAYLLGGASLASPSIARFLPARLGGFFMLVNASMLVAWLRHWKGERAVIWEPTRR